MSPRAPVLELGLSPVKQFDFAWAPALGAEYYQLLESVDAGEPYVQVGEDTTGLGTSLEVPLHFRVNASYKLRACNGNGCAESDVVEVVGTLAEAIGYIKASNSDTEDYFGVSVAMSGDGNTLAVGASDEASGATGVDGDQADNSAPGAGAVYVYVRDGRTWVEQAYVKASNAERDDHFCSVDLSDDGNTLAVGAVGEAEGRARVEGDSTDNSAPGAGAVYVFVREGQAWTEQAYIKASNAEENDKFGVDVALSGDGKSLAVGAPGEDSDGVHGDGLDNSMSAAGAVYVFARVGQTWVERALIKAPEPSAGDVFGVSVALSEDGGTLAVGAQYEDTAGGTNTGGAYVFVETGESWTLEAHVEASNANPGDRFGREVALSGDGNTLAVSTVEEASAATGIDGSQADNSAPKAGAVYIFLRERQTWAQAAYVKASNSDVNNYFGMSIALSKAGDTLAVGAFNEAGGDAGIAGDQASNSAYGAGAVYVFVDEGGAWTQRAYVKASNVDVADYFGVSVSMSGAGNTLAVGAYYEDSSATSVDGDQADNSTPSAGAVYLF